ncbi:MAG: TolC family protein [Gemmatimonadales bacterium]
MKAVITTLAAFALSLNVPHLSAQVATPPVSPTTAGAQTATPLSLEEAVRVGESHSEAVGIARAGVQRSSGQQLQAKSQYLPQIFGSGSYTRTLKSQYSGFGSSAPKDTTTSTSPPGPCDAYLKDATASVADRLAGLDLAARCASGLNPFASLSSLPFGQANQYNFGVSLSQNLFNAGRVSALTAAANAGHRSAEIELTAQRAQIILDVTQAYYDAALADRLVNITEASYTQTEKVFQQTQLAKNVGNISEFELLRAQVTRDNQRPLVIQRRSDREVAYLRLKQLLNLPLNQPVTLTTPIDGAATLPAGIQLTGLSVSDYTAPDTVASHRASVRQAAEAVAAQQSQLRVARSQRIPSLSLTSQYGAVAYPTSGLPSSNDFRANWTVGIATSFPIFTGGRIKGDELVAEANLADSRVRLQQVKEYAALDAQVAINALNEAAASWEASRGTTEQASRAYTIAEVRYKEGISTQLELNDSRILVEQATVNAAVAARNLQVARVKLALLPNLPLQTSTSSAASQQSQTQQQSTQQSTQQQQQQQQQQQTQSQSGTLANQQIPPGQ